MKKIVYIGLKDVKPDNVAATGLVWKRGEILEVEDDAKAEKLLQHTLVWRDADQPYELVAELKAVDPKPRVHVIPKNSNDPFWDPFVIPVSTQMLAMLRDGKVKPVWMSPENAEKYKELRFPEADGETLEAGGVVQAASPLVAPIGEGKAPQNTGLTPQDRETKQGLDASPRKRAAVGRTEI